MTKHDIFGRTRATVAVLLAFASLITLTSCDKKIEPLTTDAPVIAETGDILTDSAPVSEDISGVELTPIESVDNNFILSTDEKMVYISAEAPEVEFDGVKRPSENGGEYYHLDASMRSSLNDSLALMAETLPSAQLRFITNAKELYIKVNLKNVTTLTYMSDYAMRGIEVYRGTGTDRARIGHFDVLLSENEDSNSGVFTVSKDGLSNELTINLPLMAGVASIELGFPKGTGIAKPTARSYGDICVYGSSVSHGICAGAAGNNYPSILCRALNASCINLSFMGLAQGELEIAEYIGTLDISAFIMDYDYNANSTAALEATHEPFFKKVRELKPDLPIIILTRPYFGAEPSITDAERRNVIRATYENAVAAGDTNVYFIDAATYFPASMRDLVQSDNLHPNDLGFFYMAKAIYPTLKSVLDK